MARGRQGWEKITSGGGEEAKITVQEMNNQDSKKSDGAGAEGWWGGKIKYVVGFFLVIVIMAGILYLYWRFPEKIDELETYGYLGAFIIAALSAATIVVPVPGLFIIFTLGAVLNPLLLGIISGVGGTLGEMTGYLLGYSGRGAIENIKLYQRMEYWMRRWGGITILVLAAIPNPVFDIAGAIAGALRFPVWKFCLYGGLGRIIKHTVVAYAGAWGVESIFRLFS
jgi:membrane protein YqaA with SNARE-associated domain